MPLIRVRSIDSERRTISGEMQGRGGTKPANRIKILRGHKLPEIDDVILAFKDGSEYYCMDPIERERPADLERNEEEQLVPGDVSSGTPEDGAGVGIRRGGMVVLKADMQTGVIANKILGLVQMLGKRFSFDTNFFHKIIKTKTDKRNTIIDTRLAGSPRLSPLTLEMVKSIIDTSDGSIVVDLSGFDDLNVTFKFAPQALQTRGANIKIENETPVGKTIWEMNGSTGKSKITSPTLVEVDAPFIRLGSTGSPADAILTLGSTQVDPNTGTVLPGSGSKKVFAG